MKKLASDFLETSDALFELLREIPAVDYDRTTQFNNWTINDVLGHLHLWNVGADLSLRRPEYFAKLVTVYRDAIDRGVTRPDFTRNWLTGAEGPALLHLWREFVENLADRFSVADSRARDKWIGRDMSVRSSVTARQMETWAHGQEVFDLQGVDRVEMDSIKNIAVLGVNTFFWAFVNRGMQPPDPAPRVRLTAPSGATWQWNERSQSGVVEGTAVDFCRVVTQVRNPADARLKVEGEAATRWMSIAQCFAGPPRDPPPPGTRFKQ